MTHVRSLSDPLTSGDQESTWSSADKISRKVRELSIRSYEAMRANTGTPNTADLQALHEDVVKLQGKIRSRRFWALLTWVDALRNQIDVRIGRVNDEAR